MGTVLALACVALMVIGCDKEPPPPPTPPPARIDQPLSVAVIGNEELARQIRTLRGEWMRQSQGDLEVREIDHSFDSSGLVDVDVIIYPGRYLGEFVSQKVVRKLRQSVMESESVDFDDILPLVRFRELVFDGNTYALPLGAPVTLLCAASDEAEGPVQAPTSWTQFAAQTCLQSETPSDRWKADAQSSQQAVAPLSPLAVEFLLRAAPRHIESGSVGFLFDPGTMKPRLTESHFMDALVSMVSLPVAASLAPRDTASGEACFRLTWSGLASPEHSRQVVFAAAPQLKNVSADGAAADAVRPRATDYPRVSLLGARSWLVSVASATRNAPAAFELLAWLAGKDERGAIRVVESPCRYSQVGGIASRSREASVSEDPAPWIRDALTAEHAVQIPRILAIDAYLAALSEGLEEPPQSPKQAAAFLKTTAERWEEITERIGRDKQVALLQSHGFGE